MLSFPKTSFYMSPYISTKAFSFNEATISKGHFVLFLPSLPYLILWFKIKNTQDFDYVLSNSAKIVQLDNIELCGLLCTYTVESPP